MPLINSVVKSAVRQKHPDHIIIEDLETNEKFEYHAESADQYVESEILQIRVEGLERNFEIHRKDRLKGPVIDSELNPLISTGLSFRLKEWNSWNPEHLYGQPAARDFFPHHMDVKCFRSFEILAPKLAETKHHQMLDTARKHLLDHDIDKSRYILSQLLSEVPGHLESIRLLGFMHLQKSQLDVAEKYFRTGMNLLEPSLTADSKPFILPGNRIGNYFYLSFLLGTAFFHEHRDNSEKALEYYWKCYRLDPLDHLAARHAIYRISNQPMPFVGKKHSGAVDPYAFIDKYDIPIHDVYDPSLRINPDQWLDWPESYRYILILKSHTRDPGFRDRDPDTIHGHMAIHYLAETALALNDPPQIRLEVARLIAGGMSRQETIHFLGEQLLKGMQSSENQ
ncbi:hypothetical protein JXA40_12645 [bacterium]|nr:hypothetical protein [candidate division CSSED10-310 bacterium]